MKRKPWFEFKLGPVKVAFPPSLKKSWAELHSFFETVLKSSASKGTVKSQIEEYRSWIYVAVTAIYSRVGEVEFQYYRTDTDERIEKSSRVYKTINSIFVDPNPYMEYRFLKQYWQLQLDLTGMAFGLVEYDKVFGLPLYIWPLNVTELHEIHYGESFRDWIKGFEFVHNGKHVIYNPQNILYFHYPHPKDPRAGASPVQSQSYSADIDHYIDVYERDFFKNSARFDFAISYPEDITLLEEDVERLRTQWKEKFSGEGHYHELAIIDQGAKVVELTPKNEDLALMSIANWSQDKLMAAYRVPPGKVGMVKDVNKANAIGIDITFNSESIKPRLKIHDEVVTRQVLQKFDPRIALRHDNPVPRDRELDIEEIKTKVGTPIWTVNEGRKRDNLPPVDGGDVVYVPLNFMPMQSEYREPSEPVPVDDDDKSKLLPAPNNMYITKGGEVEYTEEYLDRKWYKFKAYTEGWEGIWRSRTKVLFENQKEEVIQKLASEYENLMKAFSIYREVRSSFEKKYNKFLSKYNGWSLKKVAADIESNIEAVADLVVLKNNDLLKLTIESITQDRSIEKVLALIDQWVGKQQVGHLHHVMFDWDKNMKAFDRLGTQLHSSLLLEKGNEELTLLGLESDFSLHSRPVQAFLGDKVKEFSDSTLNTKYNQLHRELTRGIEKEETLNQLSERVSGVYKQVLTGGYEAMRIARTEVMAATNAATFLAYEQSAVVEEKGWLSARDDRTRGSDAKDHADHYHMSGQRQLTSKPFVDPRSGARLMFPHDTSRGAAASDVVQCRCTIVAYTKPSGNRKKNFVPTTDVRTFKRQHQLQGLSDARAKRFMQECY